MLINYIYIWFVIFFISKALLKCYKLFNCCHQIQTLDMRNLLSIIFSSVLITTALGKTLRLEDHVYEENIRSVQFYKKTGAFDEQTLFPSVHVDQSNLLHLEFDDLKSITEGYYFKIIHCNADWTQSVLLESEYLKDFINDYLITNYLLSFNTKVKYVHYNLRTPKVRLSGNYVLAVYRGSNQDDLILTRRFIAYENRVGIVPDLKVSIGVEERFTHQQIDFGINYAAYQRVFIPQDEIKVVIRQNGRWDNAIYDLKPLYVRDNERFLDYHFFNLENNFKGGNEFRQFDCRRIRTNGINIERIEFTGPENHVYLMQERSRNHRAYALYFDINGRFIIGNNEIGGNLTDPDYVTVHFDIKPDEMPTGAVYVIGGFNDYVIDEKYKLNYDPDTESYKCSTVLKQGYYNYMYATKGYKQVKTDETELEGSFFQTENFYEIIVYHRPIGERSDFVIGYYSVKHNAPK